MLVNFGKLIQEFIVGAFSTKVVQQNPKVITGNFKSAKIEIARNKALVRKK